MEFEYESIVIGSGFGGSCSAARQAKVWGEKVLLLERGKKYKMGSFPRSPEEFEERGFYTLDENSHIRSKTLAKVQSNGLFDIRNYKDMTVVMSAGLGGGSLIYANVLMKPPVDVLEGWPKSVSLSKLEKYYSVGFDVLGGNKLPLDKGNEWALNKVSYFQDGAKKMGRDSKLVDIAVFFGNNPEKPTQPGVQETNKYGAIQTSCTLCAECDAGCNVHSKNTLDLNYLFKAQKDLGLKVKTNSLAKRLVPLAEDGSEDSGGSGEFGYNVYWRDLTTNNLISASTRRVTVSAGTLGTNELLLRCRDEYKSLPNISQKLGHGFSGNGDFIAMITGNDRVVSPNKGPVIVQRIDFDLFDQQKGKSEGRFIMEDASYPSFLAWFVEGMRPVAKIIALAEELTLDVFRRLVGLPTSGRLGKTMKRAMSGELAKRSSVHLCMGLDASDGQIKLEGNKIDLIWNRTKSMPLYNKIVDSIKSFKKIYKGAGMLILPLWTWFSKSNVTVHALGGCHLADDISKGVCSANEENFGEVFNYKNLFIADGSVLPTAVGSNPALTILAVSEKINHGITGVEPNANFN
ncbi:GMC family oxidoreductase [bacterium]|nr:GMC family oxidoreductase [bacterium]